MDQMTTKTITGKPVLPFRLIKPGESFFIPGGDRKRILAASRSWKRNNDWDAKFSAVETTRDGEKGVRWPERSRDDNR